MQPTAPAPLESSELKPSPVRRTRGCKRIARLMGQWRLLRLATRSVRGKCVVSRAQLSFLVWLRHRAQLPRAGGTFCLCKSVLRAVLESKPRARLPVRSELRAAGERVHMRAVSGGEVGV